MRHTTVTSTFKVLPRKSGRYLRAILGNVDCNILDRNEKYQYKEQYEQFKLIVNLLGGVLAIASYFFDFLVLDKLGMFLIVWYYCTLTIRWLIIATSEANIDHQGVHLDCEWFEDQGLVEIPSLCVSSGRWNSASLARGIGVHVREDFL